MARPNNSMAGFRIKCRMSRVPKLVVEGLADKTAFSFLKDLVWRGSQYPAFDIEPISELHLNDLRGIGNRELVELLCESLLKAGLTHSKVLGFVDREHRPIDHCIVQNGHALAAPNLIWSIGHSIENYCFDPDIMEEAFERLARVIGFDEVMQLFRRSFDLMLGSSHALGRIAIEQGVAWSTVVGTIDRSCFQLDVRRKVVVLNEGAWHRSLYANNQLSSEKAQAIADSYAGMLQSSRALHSNELRWTCHGHLTASLLWRLYKACVLIQVGGGSEVQAIERISFRTFERAMFAAWARSVAANPTKVAPTIVIDMMRGSGLNAVYSSQTTS